MDGAQCTISVSAFYNTGATTQNHEEVLHLNEIGELRSIISRPQLVRSLENGKCGQCGGAGFYACTWCGGSRKSMSSRFGTLKCTACNENGLMRCSNCK